MFYLDRFGTVDLPDCSVTSDMGSLGTLETGVMVAGGFLFDSYGTDRAPTAQTTIQYRGTMVEATEAELETAYRALLAKRGDLDKLYRYWPSSGSTYEWVYARLMAVRAQYAVRGPGRQRIITGLSADFAVRSLHWNGLGHGDDWQFDDGYYFDSGLTLDMATDDEFTLATGTTDCTVNNAGDVPTSNVIIRVYQNGSTALTSLVFSIGSGIFTWSNGSGLGLSNYLEIDTGTKQVRNVGLSVTDEYDNFTLSAYNDYEDWIELPPGDTTVRIVKTGGQAADTALFIFSDAYA